MAEHDPVRVEGLREFGRDLKKIDADLPPLLKRAGKDAVQVVIDQALVLVPRVTGNLAKTIRAGATLKSATAKAGTKRVPYGPLVHFGAVRDKHSKRRRNITPNPFLYKALDRRRDEVAAAFERQLVQYFSEFQGGG